MPEDFSVSDEDLERGRVILLSAMQTRDPDDRWSQFKYMKVIATDLWQSQMLRRLTPITEKSQQVQFAFNLLNEDAVAKLLTATGQGRIFGVENGQTYFVNNALRTQKFSENIKCYLPLARNYFLWPQTMHLYKNIAFLGQAKVGYAQYDKIFVSNGDWDKDADESQYIVWVNSKSSTIDYIEYVFRYFGKTYRGVVAYHNYRMEFGVALAHQIVLLDKMGQNTFSHEFYVEIFSLE